MLYPLTFDPIFNLVAWVMPPPNAGGAVEPVKN